jgi:hypothetical protein
MFDLSYCVTFITSHVAKNRVIRVLYESILDKMARPFDFGSKITSIIHGVIDSFLKNTTAYSLEESRHAPPVEDKQMTPQRSSAMVCSLLFVLCSPTLFYLSHLVCILI